MLGFEYRIIGALLCVLMLLGAMLLLLKKRGGGALLSVDEAVEKAAKYIDAIGTIDLDRLMLEEYDYRVDRHNGGLASWSGKYQIWVHFRGDDTARCVGYSGYHRWMIWEGFNAQSEQCFTYIQNPCTPFRRSRRIPVSALAAIMSAAEGRVKGFRYM